MCILHMHVARKPLWAQALCTHSHAFPFAPLAKYSAPRCQKITTENCCCALDVLAPWKHSPFYKCTHTHTHTDILCVHSMQSCQKGYCCIILHPCSPTPDSRLYLKASPVPQFSPFLPCSLSLPLSPDTISDPERTACPNSFTYPHVIQQGLTKFTVPKIKKECQASALPFSVLLYCSVAPSYFAS